MPGAYLYELQKYHQRVQAQLKLDLPLSGAGAVLDSFNCSSQYATCSPHIRKNTTPSPSHFPPLLSTSTIPSLSLSDHCQTFHHFSSFLDFLRQTLLLVLKIQLCISITSYSKMCRCRGHHDWAACKCVFISSGGAELQLVLSPTLHCCH